MTFANKAKKKYAKTSMTKQWPKTNDKRDSRTLNKKLHNSFWLSKIKRKSKTKINKQIKKEMNVWIKTEGKTFQKIWDLKNTFQINYILFKVSGWRNGFTQDYAQTLIKYTKIKVLTFHSGVCLVFSFVYKNEKIKKMKWKFQDAASWLYYFCLDDVYLANDAGRIWHVGRLCEIPIPVHMNQGKFCRLHASTGKMALESDKFFLVATTSSTSIDRLWIKSSINTRRIFHRFLRSHERSFGIIINIDDLDHCYIGFFSACHT